MSKSTVAINRITYKIRINGFDIIVVTHRRGAMRIVVVVVVWWLESKLRLTVSAAIGRRRYS